MHGDTPTDADAANALAFLVHAEFGASDPSGAMSRTLDEIGNPGVIWLKVSVYCYPTGGPTATYVGEYILPSPYPGGGALHLPNQCSLVLSLRTGLSGRSRRGRMYLPAVGVAMENDGEVASTHLAVITNTWALAFTDWNAASTPKIVVVSPHLTAYTPVTSVICDSRIDIQRSRAKSETILRSSTGVVTP